MKKSILLFVLLLSAFSFSVFCDEGIHFSAGIEATYRSFQFPPT